MFCLWFFILDYKMNLFIKLFNEKIFYLFFGLNTIILFKFFYLIFFLIPGRKNLYESQYNKQN